MSAFGSLLGLQTSATLTPTQVNNNNPTVNVYPSGWNVGDILNAGQTASAENGGGYMGYDYTVPSVGANLDGNGNLVITPKQITAPPPNPTELTGTNWPLYLLIALGGAAVMYVIVKRHG